MCVYIYIYIYTHIALGETTKERTGRDSSLREMHPALEPKPRRKQLKIPPGLN